MSSSRRFKATLMWVPTKQAAPVTKTDNPFRVRILDEDLTNFPQMGPPHEVVFKDLRERSDWIDDDDDDFDDDDDDFDDGDLKKKTKIKPTKTKVQNVSFAKDE
ncbi:hypothetical protein L6452_04848 [Arctium lappa]|uniref:Uncharacterized protein n=1 Tax=Arctium lappa TaxID=4217 RepID=A0ACB9EEC2_ARCLA|nr:hypothetical protein L6452_04848 [Arctium lappa]